MNIEKLHYIVIEGPIGAGKTSLARALAWIVVHAPLPWLGNIC